MKKNSINNYLSLVKFSHSIFAMPFAIVGFFMAIRHSQYNFDYLKLILVVLDMIFARNAAMAFNRYLDRDIDKKNDRTAIREIPSGKVKPQNALIFVILNSTLFIFTTFFINKLTFFLAPVALFVVLGYSYTKRFTPLCHIILGVGLALAPVGAYLAVSNSFALEPVLMGFVVLFWVSGFDIIYALQDEEFDRENNLKSIPVLLGKKNALHFSELLHFLSFLLLVFIAYISDYSYFYYIGTIIFGTTLVYQHRLVKPNDLSKVNIAFFTLNGIASLVFAVFYLLEIFF